MIIGTNKNQVILNIKKNLEEGKFNDKVEVNDPNISIEEQRELVYNFLKSRKKLSYNTCNIFARSIVSAISHIENKNTEYIGLENINNIQSGAIITSNHFNPLDNTAIRMAINQVHRKRLFIVSQTTNLAMNGILGFMMRYTDVIPILQNDKNYMSKEFWNILYELLQDNEWILIYPEQEMWFNYRKPRIPKRGAYYYAARANVPIISLFIEIRDIEEKETDEFYKTRFYVHILKPIYPKNNLNVRENSIWMMNQDYKQKKEAYERIYNKKLTYEFSDDDIAGWIK